MSHWSGGATQQLGTSDEYLHTPHHGPSRLPWPMNRVPTGLKSITESSQVRRPTCLVLLVASHPLPPSGDRMLETLLITELFGLFHLPNQLHMIFSRQHGEFLPRPAPKNKLVKALSPIIFNNVTFSMFYFVFLQQKNVNRVKLYK